MGRHNLSFRERLEERSIPEPNSGCLLWMGGVDHSGHGVFSYWAGNKSISTSAHRMAWRVHRGEIPTGLCVLHRCDVPSCVNPNHLWLGTNDENMADMAKKGRSKGFKPGAKHRNSKLTDEQAAFIKVSTKSGVQLAREHGVSPATICLIRRGNAWRHLEKSHGE